MRAHELGLSTAEVIAAYIVYNLVYAGLAYPAGALSDRFPRHLIFAAGLVFFAIGYLGLGIANTPSFKGWSHTRRMALDTPTIEVVRYLP